MSAAISKDTAPMPKASFWHRVSLKERALFYEHIGNLVDGGVTVVSAIASFLDKTTNPRMFIEISQVLLFVESGDPLSTAMKKIPRLFDRTETAIIEAGEQSGTLQKSFMSIAKELRDRSEIKTKIKSALTYPFVILCFLVGAIMVVMTYVVPKLIPLFASAGTELPFITQTLVASSDFIRDYFFVLIFLVAIAGFLFRAYIETPEGKMRYDSALLSAPVFGTLYRNYLIVRMSSVLGLLLSAGISIVKTLRLVGESTGNAVFEEAVSRVADRVEKGYKLTGAMEESDPTGKIFPKDVTQLIGAGEKTSTVNTISFKIADQYSREVDASITILIKFVEPIAVLVAGVFVLWFAFAIFSAVLKITEVVG